MNTGVPAKAGVPVKTDVPMQTDAFAHTGLPMNANMSGEARRQALRHRCAAQRDQLGAAVADLEARLRAIDRGVLAIRRLRAGPVLLGLGACIVAAAPVYRYISRALMLMRTVRGLLPSKR